MSIEINEDFENIYDLGEQIKYIEDKKKLVGADIKELLSSKYIFGVASVNKSITYNNN